MTKAKLEKKLFIEKVNNGNIISGYLMIKSSATMTIDKIKGVVYLEARGRMSSHKKKVLSLRIQQNKIVTENESYKFPFTFDTSRFAINSYHGKNVSFHYSFEIQIDVNKDDIEKLERSIFSKVKSFVTSDYSIKNTEYFEVENKNLNYQIEETITDFTIKPNLIVSIIAFILYGCAYAYSIPEYNIWYLVLGIASIFLILYQITKYIGNSLGSISMVTINDEAAFICKILKTRKIYLNNAHLYYEIIEEVVDNRGSSSSRFTETIYTSEKLKLPNFESNPSLKFPFPKTNGLHSNKYGDASIVWQMNLTGKYMGLTFKYDCTFKVERQIQ